MVRNDTYPILVRDADESEEKPNHFRGYCTETLWDCRVVGDVKRDGAVLRKVLREGLFACDVALG